MAEWKKIIVSGSTAELSKIVVDGHVSASLFSGSFVGDGTGLTGVSSFTVSGDTNNRVITADGAGNGVGEANLTFDGSTLTVTGATSITGETTLGDASDDPTTIYGETVKLLNVPTGTDNTVLVLNSENNIVTDEIDPRVWGTTLVDAANGVNNRLATFSDADSINGEANLTFDGNILGVTGTVNASSTISGSGLQLTAVPAGTDNTVLVLNAAGGVVSDEIDSRVWGSTLIDGSLTSGRVPYASDANTIQDSTNLTFNGTTLTANAVSVTNDLVVGGNLTVTGTTTELQVTNLNIEDQFILLNSGSTGADTGIIFGGSGGSANQGVALYYDNDGSRLTYISAESIAANATSADHTAGGYVTIAYDVDTAGQTPVEAVGNIKIDGGEAYIFV
jgi:hypothetical protein